MIQLVESLFRCALRALPLAFLLVLPACNAPDQAGPGAEASSTNPPELASVAAPAGIVFASFNIGITGLNSVHTGTILAGSPSALLSSLSQVKARGGRVLLRLHGDGVVRNDDKTFNFDKWKTQVARFKNLNFSSYISDGTIIGHFLVDEPHFPSRWGKKGIPQATVEAMAKYSKQLWPGLVTVVGAPPKWLDAATITYTYLDAGWATFYGTTSTDPVKWVANQVAAAKRKRLGMVAGLNVLDGGNGSSGFHGNSSIKWAMSASELRRYGGALLAQTYICGFTMWRYSSDYYGRTDIKSAMADLSAKARAHAKTSCRQ
jgi:hypothetical protein